MIEGFMKVHTSLLMESFSYKPSLVPRDGTITIQFKFDHPFVANQVNMWRSRNKGPGLLSLKCLKFSIHSLTPPGILKSNFIRRWFFIGIINGSLIAKFGIRFCDATLGPSLHRIGIKGRDR